MVPWGKYNVHHGQIMKWPSLKDEKVKKNMRMRLVELLIDNLQNTRVITNKRWEWSSAKDEKAKRRMRLIAGFLCFFLLILTGGTISYIYIMWEWFCLIKIWSNNFLPYLTCSSCGLWTNKNTHIQIMKISMPLQRWTNYWLRVTAIESGHMLRQVRLTIIMIRWDWRWQRR